jgi:hypothetical protein
MKSGAMTVSELQMHTYKEHGIRSRTVRGRARAAWESYHADLHHEIWERGRDDALAARLDEIADARTEAAEDEQLEAMYDERYEEGE